MECYLNKIKSCAVINRKIMRLTVASPLLLALLSGCNSNSVKAGDRGPQRAESEQKDERKAGGSKKGSDGSGKRLGQKEDSKAQALADLPAPSDEEVRRFIAEDAKGAGQGTIYATIGHLVSEGKSAKELQSVRYGMTKALNSVSMAPEIKKLRAVDPAGTVYAFNLRDFQLSAAQWAAVQNAPEAGQNLSTQEGVTVVKGDWLVFALTRPEVYDKVMGIPPQINMLEARLGVNLSEAVYMNVVESDVTFSERVLMRTPIEIGGKPGGYYWRSFDFARPDGVQKGFANPEALNNAGIPDLIAGEFFFSLPNGLQGYMLSGFGEQHRYDAQAFVATDKRRGQDGLRKCVGGFESCGYVINGESCITCHAEGINAPKKMVGTKGVSIEEANALFQKDQERFVSALREMGYDDVSAEPVGDTLDRYKAHRGVTDQRQQGGEVEAVFGG